MFTLNVLAQAQMDGAGLGAVIASMAVFGLISLVLVAVIIVAMWKIFVKAGQPGWASLVPIYNIIVMLNMVGRPVWWLLLFMIPLANVGVSIVLALDMAKSFGKETGFAIGLILLPIVFYPLLAFGDAQYVGPQQAF